MVDHAKIGIYTHFAAYETRRDMFYRKKYWERSELMLYI